MKLSLQNKFTGKLVLMSATLDPQLLCTYFANESLKRIIPVIRCQMMMHEVKLFYLEDLQNLGIAVAEDVKKTDETKLELGDGLLDVIGQLLHFFDRMEVDAEKALYAGRCDTMNGVPEKRGAVLLFVTGIEHIEKIAVYLSNGFKDKRLNILPLHSELSIEDQIRVNERPQSWTRKVIVSTNIAESSITVADVRYVVDLCMTKSLYCEKETNYTFLKELWASKSNCKQRKGRAGKCFLEGF